MNSSDIYFGIGKEGLLGFAGGYRTRMRLFIQKKFNFQMHDFSGSFSKKKIKDIYVFYFDTPIKSIDNEIASYLYERNLVYISELMKLGESEEKFRLLKYSKRNTGSNLADEYYISMVSDIMKEGVDKKDRTGTGTRSLFGKQLKFDLSNGKIPILTTKKVPFKTCLKELLWFLRGDTDNKILQKEGVHIWDKNSSREFLDGRNLNYPEGVVGPLYGWSMRNFGKKYDPELANSINNINDDKGFDQLEYVIKELKENPDSRRILMSYWNPCVIDEIPISWCHVLVQFYVKEVKGIKYLSCHFYQRSQDVFLGGPFNILSYSILTHLIAKKTGMVANELIMSLGDAHIYKNHFEQVLVQIKRKPRSPAYLIISDKVINKDWSQLEVTDFHMTGYYPHDTIKAEMSA